VPLQDLLTRAAALVHHGGIGTVAEALRAGVPQLITPFAWDQFDNGARVAALGAGAVLPAANLSAGRLARRLRALLASEAVRHRCALVAARFTPACNPKALCLEIETRALTAGHEPPRL
jgi:rhamnosyltransferase subunit B